MMRKSRLFVGNHATDTTLLFDSLVFFITSTLGEKSTIYLKQIIITPSLWVRILDKDHIYRNYDCTVLLKFLTIIFFFWQMNYNNEIEICHSKPSYNIWLSMTILFSTIQALLLFLVNPDSSLCPLNPYLIHWWCPLTFYVIANTFPFGSVQNYDLNMNHIWIPFFERLQCRFKLLEYEVPI